MGWRFNPAPGWPSPPPGFEPAPGWRPDASWPAAPQGWQLWLWVPDLPVAPGAARDQAPPVRPPTADTPAALGTAIEATAAPAADRTAVDHQPTADTPRAPVRVNGGPGYVLPTYLPPGYSLGAGTGDDPVILPGPQGTITLHEGGPEVGTVKDMPGWPYDVLDRPDIGRHRGILIRYRNDGDNTVLRWTDGADRGFVLQVFSTTLDPQELVKIARGMA
jgi:hypothetical protein